MAWKSLRSVRQSMRNKQLRRAYVNSSLPKTVSYRQSWDISFFARRAQFTCGTATANSREAATAFSRYPGSAAPV